MIDRTRRAYRRFVKAALRGFNRGTVSQVQAWPDGTVILAQRPADALFKWDVVFIHGSQFERFVDAVCEARGLAEAEGVSQISTWEENRNG